MELNHPLWTNSDYHQYHHQTDTVRSFKCSFCKRGFSNAQALGGHMNIHRKDRAKLRQLSSYNNDDHHEVVTHDEHNYIRIRRLKRSHGIENRQYQQQQQQELSQWAECNGRQDFNEGFFPQLDLELRLGPEPDHHRMAACMGTRNFF